MSRITRSCGCNLPELSSNMNFIGITQAQEHTCCQSLPEQSLTRTHPATSIPGCLLRYTVNTAVSCNDSISLCYQQSSLETPHAKLVVGICYLLNSKTCYENNSLFMIKTSTCKSVRKSPEITLFSIFYDT